MCDLKKKSFIDRSFHIFRRIQKADDGSIYVCIATNEGGDAQEQVIIHVQGMMNTIEAILSK